MSLKVISVRDIDSGGGSFIGNLQANSPSGAAGGLDFNDSVHRFDNQRGKQLYHDQFDQFWMRMDPSSGSVGIWARMDPLFASIDYGPSTLNEVFGPDVTAAGPAQQFYFVGEHDTDLAVQRVYGIDTGGANIIRQVDLNSPMSFAVPQFNEDNWRPGGVSNKGSAGAQGVEGARPLVTAQCIFFESAEPAIWPAGYALMIECQITTDAGSGLLTYERCLVQVDLADENGSTGPPGGRGRGVVVPTATWYGESQSPLHPTAHAGPLAGFDVFFDHLQFAPDDDSTISAPKGRLFLFNHNPGTGNEHRMPVGVPGVGTILHKFVKVIEWNPTGKDPTTGNVNRVHLREIVLSVIEFIEETTPENGGVGLGVGVGQVGYATYLYPFFHPPSNTLRSVRNTGAADENGNTTELVHSLTPAVANVTTPTRVGAPETGKTVRYRSEARGSFGERISGVNIDWELDRRSSKDEVLTHSGSGGTATVANPPIDGFSNTINSLIVFEDGLPLTVTANYTVDIGTGIITGVAPVFDVTKTYLVKYDHTTTPAQPPHGILRTDRSRTNANGEAFASIEVPNDPDIATEFDAISSEEA